MEAIKLVATIKLLDGERLVEMLEGPKLELKSVEAFDIDPSFFNEYHG